MCNITTRIETLNRQLIVISKLQKMEEEYNTCPYTICKKNSIYNNFGKLCHCAQRVLSLKEQCSRIGCAGECISHGDGKRKVPCNSRTCKARRELRLHRKSELLEAQEDLHSDLRILKTANAKKKGDSVSQSKSDQVNLTSQSYKNTVDKIIDTYEEKNEQTVPTRDNNHVEYTDLTTQISNTNHAQTSSTSHVQQEAPSKEKLENEVDGRVLKELGEFYHSQDVCAKDKKVFERIEKDLLNERQRTKDLEKKLKSLTCSLNCLKEESEQRAACLKGALETAEEQTKVAMDLVKQSTDQAELAKTDKGGLQNKIRMLQHQVAEVSCTNTSLLQECDSLKCKLQCLSEDESKRCEEVEKEVNRMKHAVKEKETALSKERAEFMDMILELSNVINIQKRRISETTCICNSQRDTITEKDTELSQKNAEISEMKSMFQSSESAVKEMEDKVQRLDYCLCKETEACECLRQELETLKENHSSEQRIKEKIIEEQNKTISKQRKLLHDSEEMVQQVASEFDQIKDELCNEKQKNKCLQVTLEEVDSKLNEMYVEDCKKCRALVADIDCLTKDKQRALAVAKFASQKLHQTVKQYQNKLICEKHQQRYLSFVIKDKDHEIACLRNQICQANRRMI